MQNNMPHSKKIRLAIPEGMAWPVEGRDKTTGMLLLKKGFLEAVADASKLSLAWHGNQSWPRLTEDMVAHLLIEWYFARLKNGEKTDTVIEEYIAEVLAENVAIYRCLRCGHGWRPVRTESPRICPKCKSPYWDKPKRNKK